jgi:hypothetical protein
VFQVVVIGGGLVGGLASGVLGRFETPLPRGTTVRARGGLATPRA